MPATAPLAPINGKSDSGMISECATAANIPHIR